MLQRYAFNPHSTVAQGRGIHCMAFSVLNRPPPNYPGHVPLNVPERIALGLGSAIGALRNQRRGDLVGSFAEVTAGRFIKDLRDSMLSDETGRRILRDRPRINSKTLPMEHLKAFPENTFAQCLAHHLTQNSMSLDERDDVKYIDDEECAYVMQRYRECHDFYHVVTELPPTFVEGEVALKALEFMNMRLPMTGLSLLALAKLKPEERARFWNIYGPWAFRNGLISKPLINVYWEEELGTDVDVLRAKLGIEKPPNLRTLRSEVRWKQADRGSSTL